MNYNYNYNPNPKPKSKKIHFVSDPFFFLYIYYAHFLAFLIRIYNSFFFTPVIEIELDETQKYIEKQKKIFLDTFFPPESESKKSVSWNENIPPECYLIDYLQDLKIQENNELELQWKRRILQESTPRGNIIMYYDFYKQAFAYVSDQQMTYTILNACAMKYVRIYRCFDFFVDTNILPSKYISPFSLLQEEIDKKDKEKSSEKKKELGICFDTNAPFIKSKPKPKSILKKSVQFDLVELSVQKRDYCNVFRYLGKMSNLSLLMKITPIKTHPILSIPIESFDYLAYKKMQQKKEIL